MPACGAPDDVPADAAELEKLDRRGLSDVRILPGVDRPRCARHRRGGVAAHQEFRAGSRRVVQRSRGRGLILRVRAAIAARRSRRQRGEHGFQDHQGRSVRPRRVRRHRRSRLSQAVPGALSPRQERAVHRPDPHHRRLAPRDDARGVPGERARGADQIRRREGRRGAEAVPRRASTINRSTSPATRAGRRSRSCSATSDRIRAFYLATGPDLFAPIAKRIGEEGLASPSARIIVEKPIGHDGASAAAINDALGAVFLEKNIFRIDHYLGKETVQNLMALRFANALFEPVWNSAHIDHVQITVAETLGVGGRGAYYDESGALRDMVQNHMLQLLCLVAMEPPSAFEADALRDEKLKVLKSLAPINDANVSQLTVRGQYRAGFAEGAQADELSAGHRQGGERHRDLRRAEDRRRQLALGRRAVLSAHRQAAAAALLGDRRRLPPRAARDLRARRRRHPRQPPGHPRPAGRGHQAVVDDQGPRPRRHAACSTCRST